MTESNANPVRVLIVDDEELFRTSLTKWLGKHACVCMEAPHSEAALEILRGQVFDVLITDLNMPGNTDLEFISEIPKVAPGLPVILMTGMPSVETAARSVRLPVYAYLVKPLNLPEVLTLVQQAALSSRQRRTVRAARQRLQNLTAELEQIEGTLGKGVAAAPGEAPMTGFLRATLHNIAMSIVELERSTPLVSQNETAGASLSQLEMLAALRHTVDVLEKTKQNFKSKDLGQLRHQLSGLLKIHES